MSARAAGSDASALTLYTPYDFGVGDPLDGALGRYLARRVRDLSGGAVREVAWDFDPVAARPVARRARSSDLDIHAPGDPGIEEYAAAAPGCRGRSRWTLASRCVRCCAASAWPG